jgi:DnaJ-class molecular chaperone
MGTEFEFKRFHKGYKDLMLTLHPDTSGYDSAEDFAEARRFYEVFKDKVQPEKLWNIYVMFGGEFNLYSEVDVKSEINQMGYSLYCTIESLLNLLMIFLIGFYFFNQSAKRGFFSRMSLAVGTLIYLIMEITLLLNFEINQDNGSKLYIV